MVRILAPLCLFGLILSAVATSAQEAPVTDCDRYAAETDDVERTAAGVSDDELQATLALPACERAVEQYPASRRLIFQLARANLKAANSSTAFIGFHKAAERGHVLAQTYLGTLYLEGNGVAKDDAKAVVWYRKAAEQGDAVAQFNLATMYEGGRGIAKDDAQAIVWYRKAAENGFSEATTQLARLEAAATANPKSTTTFGWQQNIGAQVSEQIALISERIASVREWIAPVGGQIQNASRSKWIIPGAIGVAVLVLLLLLTARRRRRSRDVAKAAPAEKTTPVENTLAVESTDELKQKFDFLEPRAETDVLNPEPTTAAAAPAGAPEPAAAPPIAPEEPSKTQDTPQPVPDAPQLSEKSELKAAELAKPVSHDPGAGKSPSGAAVSPIPAAVAQSAPAAVAKPVTTPPTPTKRCSHCQKEMLVDDYFCSQCGAIAVSISNCEHVDRAGARFCPRCGAFLRWTNLKATASG